MDSYHRRARYIRGHWQVRFGRVWLAVCQRECPIERLPVARAPGQPRLLRLLQRGTGRCTDSDKVVPQVPLISSAINCDGTRGPAWIQVPPGHWGPHGPASSLDSEPAASDSDFQDPLCTPPWPVFVLGICRCTDVKCHRS